MKWPVWARRPESAAPLAEAGARVHATPAELARHCEVVISVVTASADVEHLAQGRRAHRRPCGGAIHMT